MSKAEDAAFRRAWLDGKSAASIARQFACTPAIVRTWAERMSLPARDAPPADDWNVKLALSLFLDGEELAVIAERVGTDVRTLNARIDKNGWARPPAPAIKAKKPPKAAAPKKGGVEPPSTPPPPPPKPRAAAPRPAPVKVRAPAPPIDPKPRKPAPAPPPAAKLPPPKSATEPVDPLRPDPLEPVTEVIRGRTIVSKAPRPLMFRRMGHECCWPLRIPGEVIVCCEATRGETYCVDHARVSVAKAA